MEYVGRALFLEHRAVQQIMAALKEKNVTVSDREVAFLGKKFILYLVLAHKEKSPEIKQLLLKQGGYILHFDATSDGDSPHLLCAIAEVVDLVLGSVKVPTETTEAVVDFLENQRSIRYTTCRGLRHAEGKFSRLRNRVSRHPAFRMSLPFFARYRKGFDGI